MQRKSDKAKSVVQRLKQIWMDLSRDDWLSEVSEAKPDCRWSVHGPSIKGSCPWHDDPKPSFAVTPSKGIVKCFGCGRSWLHPVKFVQALRGLSFPEALLHLRKRYGLKAAIPEALLEKAKEWDEHRRRVNEIADLCCKQLDEAIKVYPAMGEEYTWAKTTVEFLRDRKLGCLAEAEPRGVGEEDGNACPADPPGVWSAICSNRLVGILPPLVVVERHYKDDPDGFTFFRKYFAAYMDNKFVGSIIFMYEDEPGSVARFKLRVPIADKSTSMFFVEDPFEADMNGFRGFFGLNYYRTYIGGKKEDGTQIVDYRVIANVTEGEFDTLAAIAQQIRRSSDDYMTLALGGASAQSLDRLLAYGIDRVRILPDADEGGRSFVRANLERTNTDKIGCEIFIWPSDYRQWRDPNDAGKRVKDPDEAIKYLGYPKWSRFVRTPDSFQHLHEWAFERASTEISKIASEDLRQRNNIALAWGRYIKHPVECAAYCDAMAKQFGMDKQQLFQSIRARDEDEHGFVARLMEIIKEHFALTGLETKGDKNRTEILHFWDKNNREPRSLTLGDERSIETAFGKHFGTLTNFINEKVGHPAFLVGDGDGPLPGLDYMNRKYRFYINQALLQLSKGLPSVDHAPRRSQGLHFHAVEDGMMRSYMINGKDVWRFVHADGQMNVERLDGPSDHGIIFDNTGQAWLKHVHKVEDFFENVDLVALFEQLRQMISTGWAWRNQFLDSTFLAAYTMCLPVMTVFTRQTALIFNAEAQSGKSRFVAGFIGGTSYPRINVVAHARALNQYTAASIRQQWNDTSLALCLEEFEDSGALDKKSAAVRNVLEMTRDLISEQAAEISIGTTSGDAKHYRLRFPLLCAAIRPLRDAASLSRFIAFELAKDDRRVDPVVALIDKFGEIGIASVRRQLAVGLLKHMPRLRQLQMDIEREYATGAKLPAHVPSRFREALYPIIAMMRLIEEQPGGQAAINPAAFAVDFAESRRDQLLRLRVTSENEQVLESILSSPFQISTGESIAYVTSIRVMLTDHNKLDAVNHTHKGVYLDLQNEWLVVNWIEASQGVLANTRFKNETPTYLKQVSERSPHHIRTDDAKKSHVLERMTGVMGPCQSYDLVTVFSVKHVLEEAKRHRESGTPSKAGGSGNGSPEAKAAAGPPPEKLTDDRNDKAVELDDDMVT